MFFMKTMRTFNKTKTSIVFKASSFLIVYWQSVILWSRTYPQKKYGNDRESSNITYLKINKYYKLKKTIGVEFNISMTCLN